MQQTDHAALSCCLFDFDDTLSRGDSIVPYLIYAIKKGYAPWYQLPKAVFHFLAQKFDHSRLISSKEHSLSFIKGRTREDMDDLARGFFSEVLVPRFFPDGIKAIEDAHLAGLTVIVVSASADVYMHVLPEFMPVDAVLSTSCALSPDGRTYTGRITSNCKGQEKVSRLMEYLRTNGYTAIDQDRSFAYGDSASDVPMLRMTGHPCFVNAKSKVQAMLPEASRFSWRSRP